MRKRILFAVTAIALVCCFALTACGTDGASATSRFDEKFAALTTPVTLASEAAINAAYDEYYLLGEDARRELADKKAQLDGYAKLCNAIVAVTDKAARIGVYSAFTAFDKKVSAANAAYDALIALDADYAADTDVAAAKKLLDVALTTLNAKKALIATYINAVALVGDYDAESSLYSEWSAQIAAAQAAYNALGGDTDDIVTLADVAAARVTLKTHASEKAALAAVIADFEAKVAEAKKVYSETFADGEPSYSKAVNAAFDAAENARLAAEALNLTADAATDHARSEFAALCVKYDGIRYPYEFTDLMSSVAADMQTPSKYAALSKTLAKAEAAYNRIPEADRESVAASKEVFDAAMAKLPELGAQKEFLDAVAAVKLDTATDITEVKTLIAAAEAKFTALVENYEYASGVAEVDKAKEKLDGGKADCAATEAFVAAVDKLPDDITNTRENYNALLAAESLYAAMTDTQRAIALVRAAYIRYHSAEQTFKSHMTAMFLADAKYVGGEEVPKGMKVFPIDAESGLITTEGALENYLQVLYTVASVKQDGVVANGKAPAADGSNVADADFDAYIAANFEYVFTIYDPVSDKKLGEITKDLHYDVAADQVPTLTELQALLPVYYQEATQKSYYYTLAVKVKATDPDLGCLILDSDTVRCEEQGTIEGSTATANRLSNANLVTLETPNDHSGVVQWGRNGKTLGGNGKFLANASVGAFDIYFYKGNTVDETNLIEWARVVKDPAAPNKQVKNYRGSSLAEKFPDLDVMGAQAYDDAGVSELTALCGVAATGRGWFVDKKAGFADCHSRAASIKALLKLFGLEEDTVVTITARLRVTDAAKANGVQDSDLAEPVQWWFTV